MIFILLVLFQLKHFIADFPLQTPYMLRKFLPGKELFLPLLAHAGLHASLTFVISLAIKPGIALQLALFDLVVHFIMDRVKAGPKYLGRYKTLTASEFPTATDKQKLDNKYFWWSLGLDQAVHHLTHYVIIYLLISQEK